MYRGLKLAAHTTSCISKPHDALTNISDKPRAKTIEEQASEITSRGHAWVERFRSRSQAIIADVLGNRTVSDTALFVPVYVRGQGFIMLPLHILLSDPDWIGDAKENSRTQCEVLPNTFMSAVIYAFLQEEAIAVKRD